MGEAASAAGGALVRHEFPASIKRAALARSGGQCEAAGERYGLPPGVRCQRTIAPGAVQFDHFPRGAHDPHPDTRGLDNCVATCPACNQHAANHIDKQREQKIKNTSYDEALHRARMERKAGLDVPDPKPPRGRQAKKGPPIKSRGFTKGRRPIPSRPFPARQNR